MGGSSSKTYSSLQVQPLMDHPDKWYKASMREAYKNIPQGMRSVMNQYTHNMIDARSMFNDGFLTSLGYNPRENVQYRVVDPDLVLSWAKSNISSSVSSVHDYRFGTPTMEELALEFIQDNYTGMDLVEKSFLINGSKWFVSGVTVVSNVSSDTTCYKNKEDTVNAYAILNGTTVISIEDKIATVKGVNYWTTVLGNGIALVPVKYTTIACPGINSDVIGPLISTYDGKVYPRSITIENDGEYTSNIVVSVKLDVNGELIVNAVAKDVQHSGVWSANYYTMVTKGAVEDVVGIIKSELSTAISNLAERLVFRYVLGGINKLMIAEVAEDLVSGIANAKAYPIIPLRENYAMVNESTSMKAVLNKLGMNISDFEKSIDDSRIKNAAVVFVVDINDTSEAGTKYIFETLVNMMTTTTAGPKGTTETNYHLDYGFSDIDMRTVLSFTIKIAEGNVAEVGKYVRSSISESTQSRDPETNQLINGTNTYQLIQKQVNEVYYQEIKIISGNTKWSVGGYDIEGTTYIPVVDIGLEKLSYEELCYILALSSSIMTTAITVVKTKWYQSGFFKFLLIVVLVVITYLSFGTLSAYTVPTMAAIMGTTVATATTVLAVIVTFTTAISVLSIMGVDTGYFGTAATVLGLGTAAIGAYGAAGSMTMQQTVLTSAKTLVDLASMAVSINTEGVMNSIKDKMEVLKETLKASEDQMQEMYNSMQQGIWMGVSDREPEVLYALSSPQMMCNYDILYDYDGMYDSKIRSVGI